MFSSRLEQEESKLFIDNILTRLMVREKRPFILPLHDGVFCPEGAVAAVVSKFEHALAKSQFQVKVKIDRYVTGKTKVLVIKENNG